MGKYRWVHGGDGTRLYDVGINVDGSLHNPRGYPPDLVHAAVLAADESCHQQRSDAAKKAAVTRKRRQEKKVYEAVIRMLDGCPVGPRKTCAICGRGLGDAASIERGIGSECWQSVLTQIELKRPAPRDARQHYRARRSRLVGVCRKARVALARPHLPTREGASLHDLLEDVQQRLAGLRREWHPHFANDLAHGEQRTRLLHEAATP